MSDPIKFDTLTDEMILEVYDDVEDQEYVLRDIRQKAYRLLEARREHRAAPYRDVVAYYNQMIAKRGAE